MRLLAQPVDSAIHSDSKIRSLKINTHGFKNRLVAFVHRNSFQLFGNFRKVGILLPTDSNFFNRLRLVLLLHWLAYAENTNRCLRFNDRRKAEPWSLL